MEVKKERREEGRGREGDKGGTEGRSDIGDVPVEVGLMARDALPCKFTSSNSNQLICGSVNHATTPIVFAMVVISAVPPEFALFPTESILYPRVVSRVKMVPGPPGVPEAPPIPPNDVREPLKVESEK
jgi:hypothetical protein